MLRRLSSRGLKAKLSKFHLAQNKKSMVGHVISAGGIRADDEKLAIIKDSPTPTITSNIRILLGWPNNTVGPIKKFTETSSAYNLLHLEKAR